MNDELAIGPLDRHFAQLMIELNGAPSEELRLAAEKVSARRGKGDICISIHDPEWKVGEPTLRAARVVGAPGENKPLILDAQGRLYLQRYWAYEQQLAGAIRTRLAAPEAVIDDALLAQGLRDYFPNDSRTESQQRAAEAAVRKNFCVITGGPGTGKTRTVLIVLMLLHAQFAARGAAPRIALTAPTGKAAARMKESMQKTLASLPLKGSFAEHLPSDATTIHRLLGALPDSPYFRHNAEHPLAVDVVIVDEASMIDLALMAKLVAAVPPTARLILLGDKDQLASVEAGAILGDIYQAAEDARSAQSQPPFTESDNVVQASCLPSSPTAQAVVRASCLPPLSSAQAATQPPSPLPATTRLHEHIVELKTNFRFGNDSEIYKLSRCITEGRGADALALLQAANSDAIRAQPLPAPSAMAATLRKPALDGFRGYLETSDPHEALTRFNDFRILCGIRNGPYGVETINSLVERILTAEGLITPIARHYKGRPIIVLKNDHSLKLYNGDTGIILPDPEAGGALRAFFLTSEGSIRRLIPTRLPEHETVFAMTVHKSQGSEFGRVLFILPDRENPIITRELIYTGLTRAREGLELWHRAPLLRTAIDTPAQRASGLRDALAPNPCAAAPPTRSDQKALLSS